MERSPNFIFVLFAHFVVFFWFITPRRTWRWHRLQPNREKSMNPGKHGKKSRCAAKTWGHPPDQKENPVDDVRVGIKWRFSWCCRDVSDVYCPRLTAPRREAGHAGSLTNPGRHRSFGYGRCIPKPFSSIGSCHWSLATLEEINSGCTCQEPGETAIEFSYGSR